MAIKLPGPDRPKGQARWRVKPTAFKTVRGGDGWFYLPKNAGAGKPATPKTTKGNRYTSAPPPSSRPAPGAASGGTPAAPAAPAGPYDRYKDTAPWAIPLLEQIDRDQAAHQAYGSTVGDWLGKSLAALTGVDPNQPGYNQQVQQQYLANVAGSVGGALGAAAASVPMAPAAVGPGGIVAGNLGYAVNAGKEASAVRASTAQQLAQAQANLNNLQTNTYAQGIVRAYADMQAGLPAIYSQRRNEQIANIDKWIAEQQQAQAELEFEMAKFDETKRHNRVTEATSAWNAQTNSAIALANLGLKADAQAFGQAQDLAGAAGPVPTGFVRLPNGKIVRDPTYQNPGSGGGKASTKGKYTPNELKKQGFIQVPKGAGAKWTKNAVKATDGRFYIKKGSGGKAGGSTPKPKDSAFSLSESLRKTFGREGDGGLGDTRFSNDPQGGGEWIAGWVREKKAQFAGKNRQVDLGKLMKVLDTIGGRPANIALDILQRGYMKKVNGVWVWR